MASTSGIIRKALSAGRLAACLALVAAGIQALIPLLIAAELSVLTLPAAAADAPCSMGQEHHDGTRRDAPAKHHAHHCPLCTALHASNGVITPIEIAPQPPRIESRVTAVSGSRTLDAARFPASYSPRAPPLVG